MKTALSLMLLSAGIAVSAVRNDFDGDGKSDPVLYEPQYGTWAILLSGLEYERAVLAFGRDGLAPVTADYDGDGLTDLGGYDEYNAIFYARLSGNSYALSAIPEFGCVGFVPLSGDFDGDGLDDPAIYHQNSGTWCFLRSGCHYALSEVSGFGGMGFVPASADYDGDGQTDLATYHAGSGLWFVRPSGSDLEFYLVMGGPDYKVVHGDFDGDRRNDPAVYRAADGNWKILLSKSGSMRDFTYGGSTMIPATGDYDGDGLTDPALHNETQDGWSVLLSGSAYTQQTGCFAHNGASHPDNLSAHPKDNDKPVPYAWKNWMCFLDNSLYLSEITIPGTHDSGADLHTSQQGCMANYVIAHDYRLANQLKMGVRWFDIRLRLHNGALTVHHGNYYLHKNFDDMLKPALDFLKTGSEGMWEVVVFMIKQEKSDASNHEFGSKVYAKLQHYGLENFYLKNEVPTVGEARGKIVIVRRFGNDLGVDFGMHFDWSNNTKGSSHSTAGIDYYVQDHYSLNTVHYKQKVGEIEDTIGRSHRETNRKKFYLNFTSGEKDAVLISVKTVARYVQAMMGPCIRDITSRNWRRCGVIMMDFAGGSDNGEIYTGFVLKVIDLNDGVPRNSFVQDVR